MAYSPTRTVYPSQELAHIWAHGQHGDRHLRCAASFSISGNRAVSYNTEIARRVFVDDTPVFLINSRSYSVTTGKHQGWIRRAIPSHSIIIYFSPSSPSDFFNAIEDRDWRTVLDYYQKRIDSCIASALKPRIRTTTRLAHITSAHRLRNDWFRVHSLFKFRCKPERLNCPQSLEDAAPHFESAAKAARIREAANERLLAERRAQHEAKQLEQNRKIEALLKPHIPAWRDGENPVVKDTSIYGYDRSFTVPQYPTPLLRITNSELETSLGAAISLDEAHRVLNLLPSLLSRLNGSPLTDHSISIGGYRGITLTRNTLTIGCHHIPWPEVAAFCSHYSWPCPALPSSEPTTSCPSHS